MAKKELPSEIYSAVKKHSFIGDELAKKGQYKAAIEDYNKAWNLLPVPKEEWNVSTWLLIAILDGAFLGKDYTLAREVLHDLDKMEDAAGNPFVHMRRGQVLYEDEDFDEAADELMLAYMAEGKKIFSKDDPKYYDFLKTRARDLK